MNVKEALFKSSQEGLFETIDIAHPLAETQRKEFEYYAVEYCTKAIIDYYKAKENSEKNPKKLINAVFNAGLFTRFLFDSFDTDTEARNKEILSFLCDFGLWEQSDGWVENRLTTIEECEKYDNSLELTISDTTFLTYQNSIKIDDTGNLKDMLTILFSVFLFACCIRLNFE